MIASLPMYDAPDTQAALWSELRNGLRGRGIAAPDALDVPRDRLTSHWARDDLVFSQTCGGPLVTALRERVCVLGAPVYDLPHCGEGMYSSLIVAADPAITDWASTRGRRLAANDRGSLSGWMTLRHLCDPAHWFRCVTWTGSHLGSMAAVRGGQADVAAIDAVTWHLDVKNWHLDVKNGAEPLRIVATTPRLPALPFICAASHSHLRRSITDALEDAIRHLLGDGRLDEFGLVGIRAFSLADYDAALRAIVR